jgi:hypothetical protein
MSGSPVPELTRPHGSGMRRGVRVAKHVAGCSKVAAMQQGLQLSVLSSVRASLKPSLVDQRVGLMGKAPDRNRP